MGELLDLLKKIDKHCSVEDREKYYNRSIGRGEMTMRGISKPQVIWISNTDPKSTYGISRDITGAAIGTFSTEKKEIYEEKGTLVVSKNKEYARILLSNYEGTHSCKFNGVQKTFLINNSAHYIHNGSGINNIDLGIAGEKNWSHFKDLKSAYDILEKSVIDLQQKQKLEKEAREKAEELRLRRQAELLQEEEKRRLDEELKRVEEEQRKMLEEVAAAERKNQELLAEASKVAACRRQLLSLKRNPVLDASQNSAKFSNLYNGVAEIIDGGPGTGKTTTMIQRLKLLIDKEDLRDYRDNHNDFKISDTQLENVFGGTGELWMYFSPNDLLKKYLEDNMSYEGLTQSSGNTYVWSRYLHYRVRDDYHLAGLDGNGCPFEFAPKKKNEKQIYIQNHMDIVESFTQFYIDQIKKKFLAIANIDVSKFEWKILGSIISQECEKIESVKNVKNLMTFLINLEGVDKNIIINKVRQKSGAEILNEYNASIRTLASKYVVLLKKDEVKYNEVVDFIKSHEKGAQSDIEDADEVEDIDENDEIEKDVDIVLLNKISTLLKKLTLKVKDASAKLSVLQQQLFDYIRFLLVDEEIKALGDSAYFVKYVNPALKGVQQYMFNSIPKYYKQYRKSLSETDRQNWNVDLLAEILNPKEGKNKLLLAQEQSLLIGFINNLCRLLYQVNSQRFFSSSHKYILAYREACRPVIGVDEATDYSLIEHYGIKSFGHYDICSYTLSGDIMQLMKEDGLTDWNQLKHPLLYDKIEVHNLTVSYRQSANLLSLANKIYQIETHKKPPYHSFFNDQDTPKPLWLQSDDLEEKAEWIAQRVVEITKTYHFLPTISIFTATKASGEALEEALEESVILSKAGIEAKVCSGITLEDDKTLRIFPIDQVKGMEFEAVFFYDIDEIESTSLINKYLYVGLSRAAMYLAVTSTGKSKALSKLKEYFDTNSTWA